MSSLSAPSLSLVERVVHHENADRLDIVFVDGCPAIVGRDEFVVGEQVVFVPFDSVLPKEGNFPERLLGKRVRPMKLRGVFSMALVLKNTWGLTESDDVAEKLGITKWETPAESHDGEEAQGPPGIHVPKYDLESLRKYKTAFIPGESVIITEKLHGTNARFVVVDDVLYVGSRNRWLKETDDNMWWKVAKKYEIYDMLKHAQGCVLYGEIYGQVQDLRYDTAPGELLFAAFDWINTNTSKYVTYIGMSMWCGVYGIPLAPVLYAGPWLGFDEHAHLAEGQSTIAKHVREGFVVKPYSDLAYPIGSRPALKLHGQGFLLRKESK